MSTPYREQICVAAPAQSSVTLPLEILVTAPDGDAYKDHVVRAELSMNNRIFLEHTTLPSSPLYQKIEHLLQERYFAVLPGDRPTTVHVVHPFRSDFVLSGMGLVLEGYVVRELCLYPEPKN